MTGPKIERRAHKRFSLSCPAVVNDRSGRELLHARTANVSDGGALLRGGAQAPEPGRVVRLNLRVPRQTPNTFMYEDFSSDARVVRCQPEGDGSGAAVAFMFTRPLKLELELEV